MGSSMRDRTLLFLDPFDSFQTLHTYCTHKVTYYTEFSAFNLEYLLRYRPLNCAERGDFMLDLDFLERHNSGSKTDRLMNFISYCS